MVVVEGAEGGEGAGGLVIMLMHPQIGRWQKEWDSSQTLIFPVWYRERCMFEPSEAHVFALVHNSVFGTGFSQKSTTLYR